LCDLDAVVSATTSTTTLDDAYPNGWEAQPASEAVMALAAVLASSRGVTRNDPDGPSGPVSPFLSLNRRYP
jgi:hypothetical protein